MVIALGDESADPEDEDLDNNEILDDIKESKKASTTTTEQPSNRSRGGKGFILLVPQNI